ncbi:hypothetical protein VTJ49DRAFT_1537 [Mycothermus thermophilus]|uniref:Uncharacterized protein n=1 Tax=Humicola insolens TaxID=85995 RepID=A0ABR3VCE0_HUMIN
MDVESLIKTLRAYDPSFDAAAWAKQHITPDTLLTVDELKQYALLEESGLAERFAASDLTATCPLSSDEVRDAIAELNRSTQAITKHTETLHQQAEALGRLADANRRSREERAALEAGQARGSQSERDGLTSYTAELLHSLNSRILDLDQQTQGAGATIPKTVDTLLRADDKLLTSLQKLAWELETEDAEEKQDVAMLRETCARLIKFTVEGVRTRLDRIFLEALETAARQGAGRVPPDEVTSLQGELESLYAEILPVTQMSAEQQFLEPALKSIADKNAQRQARSAQATNYIHDCLDYLIDRARDLAARLEAFRAYQVAAMAVLGVAKGELETQRRTEETAARQKNAAQQAALSPVKPRSKQLPKSLSRAAGLGEESPLDEILRTLAISLSQDDGNADKQSTIRELAATLLTRRAKLDDVAQNVQETFERTAIRQIADGKLAIQMVRDSILAESPFGEVRLLDSEIEGSIAVLSQELASVDEKLKRVDADMAMLRGRNAKRDELVKILFKPPKNGESLNLETVSVYIKAKDTIKKGLEKAANIDEDPRQEDRKTNLDTAWGRNEQQTPMSGTLDSHMGSASQSVGPTGSTGMSSKESMSQPMNKPQT